MTLNAKMIQALGVGLLLAAGCGNSVETQPTGSGGGTSTAGASGTGGSATSGSATSGSATSGSATSGSATSGSATGSSGTGGDVCAGFGDEDGLSSVTVRFHNKSGQVVYLPSGCNGATYHIQPATGDDGINYGDPGGCLSTCSTLHETGPIACGACAPIVYKLEPGATRDVTWNGTGVEGGFQMPKQCFKDPSSAAVCDRIVAAKPGGYFFDATGFSSCGAGCTCDADGVCGGLGEGNTAVGIGGKIDYPKAGLVDVVFDVCAFGCAAPL